MRKMIIVLLTVLNWFIDYMVETFWNKVLAIVLALCGWFLFVYTGELTVLIFTTVIAVITFFARRNVTNI